VTFHPYTKEQNMLIFTDIMLDYVFEHQKMFKAMAVEKVSIKLIHHDFSP
jgi:hypothetical protein